MKTLYLRIYLTVVAVLLVFALVSAWIWHANVERARIEGRAPWQERLGAWAELAEESLPAAGAPAAQQREALAALSQRLRLPLALDGAGGERIAATEGYPRPADEPDDAAPGRRPRTASLPLADGRTLWVARPPGRGMMHGPPPAEGPPRWLGPPPGVGLVATLVVLFGAISLGAWPVVRRLTRRLEALKQGVEDFGAGALSRRVAADGNDEVAAVAASFNRAAERIEALVGSHRSLLANASHELRSPLARMKMALALLDEATPSERAPLRREIESNIGELDALVEEVLLASRLEATAATPPVTAPVDLLGVVAEEAAHFGAELDAAAPLTVAGEERLLRRALRNLLENARRHGGGAIAVGTARRGGRAIVRVCDRGPGVPEAVRERIFEPFFRVPGQSEQAGGVGLGLALVKQIAGRHGGSVRCLAREGGGSCFELELPLPAAML